MDNNPKSSGNARGRHRLPFDILYEDRDVIVIDKPAGLLTTHTKVVGRAAREAQLTAENLLNDYVRKGQLKSRNRVWLVHRLDRETSGVMMFAKSEEVAEGFRARWNELTEKTYVAKVQGAIKEKKGVYESYLLEDADGYKVRSVAAASGDAGGSRSSSDSRNSSDSRDSRNSGGARKAKFARTEWRLLDSRSTSARLPPDSRSTSLVEVSLKSGRKNQIRVHFSEAGHPVIGDVKYGGPKADRLYLHALRLRFRHPHTGKWLEFSSPSPF